MGPWDWWEAQLGGPGWPGEPHTSWLRKQYRTATMRPWEAEEKGPHQDTLACFQGVCGLSTTFAPTHSLGRGSSQVFEQRGR